MSNVTQALRLLLSDLSKLQVATYAAAIAGVVAPIVAALVGVKLTAAEVTGWLVIAGGVAATVERVFHIKAAKAAAERAGRPTPKF